jgi:DNA-binding protein H-NS
MTAKTLVALEKQRAEIDAQIQAIRTREIPGVVQRIKEAIAHYGLTPDDLFNGHGRRPNQRTIAAMTEAREMAKTPSKKATKRTIYRDPKTGATWNGNGRRPSWIVALMDAGRDKEEFRV